MKTKYVAKNLTAISGKRYQEHKYSENYLN